MTPCTLLLTPQFLPDRVVSWEKAVVLLFLGKLEVLEEYDVPIRSPRLELLTPAVARLVRGGKPRRRVLPFSRNNVLRRDDFRCQYCGHRFAPKELSLDHVLPRSRGGPRTWENIVACCFPCNTRKGNRTPEEARFTLLRRPVRPKVWSTSPTPLVLGATLAEGATVPGEWLPYLPRRADRAG
jgi:5-methylcytosine-specific restriction endonuclease McrA